MGRSGVNSGIYGLDNSILSLDRQTATAIGCAEKEIQRLPENALSAVGEGEATHEDDIRHMSQLWKDSCR